MLTEENVKKCLSADQKIIRIEVRNIGNFQNVQQNVNLKLVKVNDANYDTALKNFSSQNFKIREGRSEANNWKGGESGMTGDWSFAIEKYLKVHQIFTTEKRKEQKFQYFDPVPSTEVYETAMPVLNFELEYMTSIPQAAELTKEVKIYYGQQLMKTYLLNAEALSKRITINNLNGFHLLFNGRVQE